MAQWRLGRRDVVPKALMGPKALVVPKALVMHVGKRRRTVKRVDCRYEPMALD